MVKKSLIFAAAAIAGALLLGGCTPKEFSGDELITYYNADREAVIEEYVGDVIKSDEDLTEYISSKSYEDSQGRDGYYDITVENEHEEYFYNGTMHFEFGKEKVDVNVHMLAPGQYQYFSVKLSEEPVSYNFDVSGAFYGWSDAADIDIDFDEEYLDDTGYDEQVILPLDKITEDDAAVLGKHFYSYDTLFNYDSEVTYYLVKEKDYNDGYDYNLIMLVDTVKQTVTFKDIDGKVVKTLTF